MLITVNGQPHDTAPGATVETLLAELKLLGRPCAVELNRRLVPKPQHATQTLSEGDVVEVVTLVGGG